MHLNIMVSAVISFPLYLPAWCPVLGSFLSIVNSLNPIVQSCSFGDSQGSILKLFHCMYTSMTRWLYHICRWHESVLQWKRTVKLSEHANKTLLLIKNSAIRNHLRVNKDKTKAILFPARPKIFKLLPVAINNTQIEIVPHKHQDVSSFPFIRLGINTSVT